MKKNLEYYLELNYPIELIQIPVDEGGGYSVCIPQLGRNAFVADGETIEEALNNLHFLKEEYFSRMIEKNIPIPEPVEEKEEEYSGKFVTRVPRELHRELVKCAKKNGSSLNQYLQYIITIGLTHSTFEQVAESYCNKFEKVLTDMKSVSYVFEQKKLYKEYNYPGLHLVPGSKNPYSDYSKAG